MKWKILLLILVLIAAAIAYPPSRAAALALVGRSEVCTVRDAWRAPAHLRALTQTKDRILAASRKLRTEGPLELWETPKGRYWIHQGNQWGLPWNLSEQENNIYGVGELFVRRGDVVLDCGAHVGVFARKALEAGAGLVVAIEPAPENVECLRRNLVDEIARGRVIVVPKGVWDREDVLKLRSLPSNTAADSFVMQQPGAAEGPEVPLTTIDRLVQELHLERVDFIKMDIEGAEQKALSGARNTIAEHHPRLAISAYHLPEDPIRIPQVVRQAWSGYEMYCGPCAMTEWRIRPDVLHFVPAPGISGRN